MKHFIESREAVIAALSDPTITGLHTKICAIFDLKGMCRILVRPAASHDLTVVESKLGPLFAGAADVFWGNELWIDSPTTTPSKRAVYEVAWHQAAPHPLGQDRTFVLDRRLSKDSWFGSPFSPPWPLNDHTAPIVSFFSFKGGVGRTTSLAAVAVNLARAGKRVLVLDFDLESPGADSLFVQLGGQTASHGVVDFILGRSVIGSGQIDVAEYCHVCDDPKVISNGPEIVTVPAGTVDQDYLEKLARINYDFLYRTASEPNAPDSPLHELLKMLRKQWQPDYVLVDSRAGFHDLGGLSLSGVSHWHVLFGLASEQSWAGLAVAVDHLGRHEVLAGRRQRDCTLIHALAPPPGAVRDQAVKEFKERAFQVFADCYFDPADQPDAEWPVPDLEGDESPHYPFVLTWDNRLAGFRTLSDVADLLAEGEYRSLTNLVLERLGRQCL